MSVALLSWLADWHSLWPEALAYLCCNPGTVGTEWVQEAKDGTAAEAKCTAEQALILASAESLR